MTTGNRTNWASLKRIARQGSYQQNTYSAVSHAYMDGHCLENIPTQNQTQFCNELHRLAKSLSSIEIELQLFLISYQSLNDEINRELCSSSQQSLGFKSAGHVIKLSDHQSAIIGYGSNSFLDILTALRQMSFEPKWRAHCQICHERMAEHLRIQHLSLPIYNLVDPMITLAELVERQSKKLTKFYIA